MSYILGQDKPSLEDLAHHGVKGMKWGVRKDRETPAAKAYRKETNKLFKTNYTSPVLDRRFAQQFGNGLTPEQYSKLKTHDIVIRRGTTIHRVVKNSNVDTADRLYVSTSKRDADIYRAVMPGVNHPFSRKNYGKDYELTYKAITALRSPSEKARVDAFIHLMDSPEIKLNNGKTVTGRELLKRAGYGRQVRKLDSTRLGLRFYHEFVAGQGLQNAPLNSAYFNHLKTMGYNAVIDDHDRNIVSHEPLIVLDAKGTLKNTGVTQMSLAEVQKAQRMVKPPTGGE